MFLMKVIKLNRKIKSRNEAGKMQECVHEAKMETVAA